MKIAGICVDEIKNKKEYQEIWLKICSISNEVDGRNRTFKQIKD